MKELITSADALAKEAEVKGDLLLLTKSNSLRNTACKKSKALEEVQDSLNKKVDALKV